jgi:hypothetical protein
MLSFANATKSFCSSNISLSPLSTPCVFLLDLPYFLYCFLILFYFAPTCIVPKRDPPFVLIQLIANQPQKEWQVIGIPHSKNFNTSIKECINLAQVGQRLIKPFLYELNS